jgi:DNA modification methylase
MSKTDLFGNHIVEKMNLRETFGEPPFSVFQAMKGDWQARKKRWKRLGVHGEIGRVDIGHPVTFTGAQCGWGDALPTVSVFDPVLCELLVSWYSSEGGSVLDPYAGGSTRGLISGYLGRNYTGIDIRSDQVQANKSQLSLFNKIDCVPNWIAGNSIDVLPTVGNDYDMVLTCPPYYSLEKYSDIDGDISNMPRLDYEKVYARVMQQCYEAQKHGGYACWVVGDVRDSNGYYMCLPEYTVRCALDAGYKLYNRAILAQPTGNAGARANSYFKVRKKLVKVHEEVFIFLKP